MTEAAEKSSLIERTVFVEGLRISVEKLAQKIKPLFAENHGDDAVLALVRRRDGYDVTFNTQAAVKDCLENGLILDGKQYDAVSSASLDVVVTFNPVAAYIEDSALTQKLTELGCQIVGEVKRVQIGGIETGRRKVVAKLPQNTRSLPRAIMVKSPTGRDERVDVYHRNQRIRKATR